MLGVKKSSPNSPFAPAERCTDRADLLSSFAGSHVRIDWVAHTTTVWVQEAGSQGQGVG